MHYIMLLAQAACGAAPVLPLVPNSWRVKQSFPMGPTISSTATVQRYCTGSDAGSVV